MDQIKQLQPDSVASPATKSAIRDFVATCLAAKHSRYLVLIRKHNLELYARLLTLYPAQSPAESLYLYLHNLSTAPLCAACNTKRVKFEAFSKGYGKYCSTTCSAVSQHRTTKRQQTNLKKYGHTNVLASPHGLSKRTVTIKEKYGVDHYTKTQEFRNKFTATMTEKYGTPHAMQSSVLAQKYKQSMQVGYGVNHPSQSKELYVTRNNAMKQKYGVLHAMQNGGLREKHRRTLQANYGVSSPLQSPIIQHRMRQTMIELYGKEYTSQVDFLFDRMRQTNIEKYGVEYPQQSENIRRKTRTNMERLRKWIPETLLTDFALYYKRVWQVTNKQPLDSLPLFEHRGLAGIDGAHHVDHKVSIKYGFENNIPPFIVGNIHNLEMLPWRDNVYKSSRCSIDPEILFDVIFASTISMQQP